jgi:hypothetical protein
MKAYFLFFALALLTATQKLGAQKQPGNPVLWGVVPSSLTEKVIPDTLFHNFFNLNPVLYSSPNGGWMSGTNGYGDTEKAQEIKFTETYLLGGFIYWFALKNKTTGGDTSSLVFKLYKKDSAEIINGLPRLAPGTLFASDTLLLSNLSANVQFESGLNVFSLSQPLVMNNNYVGAFSMELMHPKDSAALFGSTDGQVNITDYSWERWNGKWNTIKNSWTLDVDFAIFPIIDLTAASMNESDADNFRVFPNPATHTIQWKNAGDMHFNRLVILTAEGKSVKSKLLSSGETAADISDLTPGFYLLGLHAEKTKETRFVKFQKN